MELLSAAAAQVMEQQIKEMRGNSELDGLALRSPSDMHAELCRDIRIGPFTRGLLKSRVLMVNPGNQLYHIHRYLRLKKHTPLVCECVSRKDGQVGQ